MKIVNADSLQALLKKAGKDTSQVDEKDLRELGFVPTNAWISKDGDLVVFEAKGGVHNIGVAFWHI